MQCLIVHVPRLSLSGGNIITMELCNEFITKGYKVILFDGFQFHLFEQADLKKRNKGVLNTFLNLLAFIGCSFVSLFSMQKVIATHHLTAMFSFVRPTYYAFVQDLEVDFYPNKIKRIGAFFWRNYLKSNVKIYTNRYLQLQVGLAGEATCKGAIFTNELLHPRVNTKFSDIDFFMVLRDGDYKGSGITLSVFQELYNKGYKVVLVNCSKQKLDRKEYEQNIYSSMARSDFLSLLSRSKCFICLSVWEGLGLPNIEAYLNGVAVISTPIPSANLLASVSQTSISLLEKEVNVSNIVYQILEQYNCLDSTLESSSTKVENIKKLRDDWIQNYFNIIIRK
ncbi:glycosyltransferase [Colwellia echini]|uniref:Glycosyltransferase family 4 protein n=1 Tax=Colwellia echini TaxID=1982103 RepID=A0ABY3MUE6_9GAMM|nr:glycosyltransferase [Colwellia echini]TYK64722.1 glycosyltransferase family 4 protein [Colwellia echini]